MHMQTRVDKLFGMEHRRRYTGYLLFYGYLLLTLVPWRVQAERRGDSDQLTNHDVSHIVSLLRGQPDSGQGLDHLESAESAPVPSKVQSPQNMPSPEDLAQSLSLISTLLNSGSMSPEAATLLGLGSLTTPPTTTTTTESPGKADAEAELILRQLLGANAPSGANAGSQTGNADIANLAALLQSQSPGGGQTSAQQQKNAAEATLLTNLLLSAAAGQQPGLKQQDFNSFQNAGASLDAASSNQLSQLGGVLNLLGTLGSLAGPQPSLFNFGQQKQQSNPLASLLGGGSQANLLTGLLGGSSATQTAQKPGLIQSLGTLASVVGSAVRGSPDDNPKLRGVDTRLGLGYRFGDNADAQVVFEIGPQLFTEPLTTEQKQQLLLQQQMRQQASRRQGIASTVKGNRHRVASHPKRTIPASSNRRPQSTPIRRQDVGEPEYISTPPRRSSTSPGKGNSPQRISVPKQTKSATSAVKPVLAPPTLASLPHRKYTEKARDKNYLNYYAKEEVNPRTNQHSQLTEYEIWLLTQPSNTNPTSVGGQDIPYNSKPAQLGPIKRKDNVFTFSKDRTNKVVRVRVQPRPAGRHTQVVHALREESGGEIPGSREKLKSGNNQGFESRMGYTTPEDSYAKRNAGVMNSQIRDLERSRERQEHVQQMQHHNHMKMAGSPRVPNHPARRQHLPHQPQHLPHQHLPTRRAANPSTLKDWSDRTGYLDFMKNYVVNSFKNEGNKLVQNLFHSPSAEPVGSASRSAPSSLTNNGVLVAPPVPGGVKGVPTTEAPGILSSAMKGLFSLMTGDGSLGKATENTPKPIIRVGDQVSYDELRTIINPGAPRQPADPVVPMLHDSFSAGSSSSSSSLESVPFKNPNPEIFIDIANGEVSMRKAFGTMESFTPPTPLPLPQDSPKHVFNVLKEQLKEQYQKVKMEQMKEAAKKIRQDNIAQGLSDPKDPLYMASNFFDLMEKEQLRKRMALAV